MEKWSTEKLGDIVSHKKGFAFKSDWFIHSGVPVVKVTNFNAGSIDSSNLVYVHENIAIANGSHKLIGSDVVVQTVGSWPNNPESVVGKVVRIPNTLEGSLLNQNAVILRPKTKIRNDYLFYLLKDRTFKGFIINTAQGSANQASITLESIFRFEFYLPPPQVQQKIAAILSAYDDLIENNKRRITLLEKMAEEIYREWFVRMRFPGHKKANFVKGVPEGWEIKKVAEIVERKHFGRIYRESELFTEGPIVVIDQSRKACLGFHEGKPEHVASIEQPLILFGDHSCKMQFMIEPFSLAENVIPFSSKNCIPILFLFHLAYSLVETSEYKRHWTELINKQVFVPSHNLQKKFNEAIRSSMLMDRKLKTINLNLIKTRDYLLPRLISGKLSVENLDIQFPPSMQEEMTPEKTEAARA